MPNDEVPPERLDRVLRRIRAQMAAEHDQTMAAFRDYFERLHGWQQEHLMLRVAELYAVHSGMMSSQMSASINVTIDRALATEVTVNVLDLYEWFYGFRDWAPEGGTCGQA